ncbi:hypothetical protein A1351_23105, partial [Methylosinus sp. R-45379]|uniref:aminoglycoside phosphotransferase family protein n=1 Tax=Methylosinus sp. R-45379 TaxID=980563 RepID=UPI0007C969BE
GEPITTPSARLLPVRHGDVAAMLKISSLGEEHNASALLSWWDGNGAARVLAHDGEALLMERATGSRSLVDLVRNGRDDEATLIVCDVVRRLHGRRSTKMIGLSPLVARFRSLWDAAERYDGIWAVAAGAARRLLAEPRDVAVLHGDVHHGNILDFGARGWLAIDPKGLSGERGYDYANILCNPDEATSTAPGRLARQATLIAQASGIEYRRLLEWTLAHAALSAAWFLEDGGRPECRLAVAEAAARELESI